MSDADNQQSLDQLINDYHVYSDSYQLDLKNAIKHEIEKIVEDSWCRSQNPAEDTDNKNSTENK